MNKLILVIFALAASAALYGCGGARAKADLTGENKTSGVNPMETKDNGNSENNPAEPINSEIYFPDWNVGGKNSMGDFIGANHIWADYSVLGNDCLSEGGKRIAELGSTTIKVYLTDYYQSNYKVNMDWEGAAYSSPTELTQNGHFKKLFSQKELKTIVIGTYIFDRSYGHPATYFINSFTGEAREKEYNSMYELAYYLCNTYEGTGKTFIIQNWESDWACMPEPKAEYDPPEEVFGRLTEWINTRQDAVMAARRDAGCEDVYIYNCLEVNLVKKAMDGGATVTNNVIPFTYCDFYSYSCYDTQEDEVLFSKALKYLSEKVAGNLTNGMSRCYIGEFGYPDTLSAKTAGKVAESVVRIAREEGYSHAYWWQLYDTVTSETFVPGKDYFIKDYMGYWLIKCDGTYTEAWNILYKAINGRDDPNYTAAKRKTALPLYIKVTDGGALEANGIEFKNLAYDGDCKITEHGGRWCIASPGEGGQVYMYFDVTSELITSGDRNLTLTVTYFDEGDGGVQLHYNGADGSVAKAYLFKRGNTREWVSETITLTDAGLDDLFHGGFCDLRLYTEGSPLHVSEITLTK